MALKGRGGWTLGEFMDLRYKGIVSRYLLINSQYVEPANRRRHSRGAAFSLLSPYHGHQECQCDITNFHLNQDEVNARIAEIHGKSLRIQRLNTGWLSRQSELEPKPDHPKLFGRTNLPRDSINHRTTIVHYIEPIKPSAVPAHDTVSGGLLNLTRALLFWSQSFTLSGHEIQRLKPMLDHHLHAGKLTQES